MMLMLLACGGPPGGVLMYVEESAGVPHTIGLQTPGVTPRRLAKIPLATFPGPADPRGTDALIVGVDEARGHVESLWLLPLDGGPARDLGFRAPMVRNPTWTEDGSSILVEADPLGFRDVYRITRDGTASRLTDHPAGSFEPVATPDGAGIVFVSSRDGNPEIYRAQADGSGVTRLTDHPGEDKAPAFGAGGRITWLAQRDGTVALWSMAADGSDARPFRAGAKEDVAFAWSPDRAHVAIVQRVSPTNLDLVVFDAEGGQVQDLSSPEVEEQPAWSPDGAWLAFTSGRDGNPEIYLATLDGALRRVTVRPEPDWLPRWIGRAAGKTAWDDLKPPPLPNTRPSTPTPAGG